VRSRPLLRSSTFGGCPGTTRLDSLSLIKQPLVELPKNHHEFLRRQDANLPGSGTGEGGRPQGRWAGQEA
jgi:hypothetical protein